MEAAHAEALHLLGGMLGGVGCCGGFGAGRGDGGGEFGHDAADHVGAFGVGVGGGGGDGGDFGEDKLGGEIVSRCKYGNRVRGTYRAVGVLDSLDLNVVDLDHLSVEA